MQKHIILLLMTFCLAACRPDEGEEKVEVQPSIEETIPDTEKNGDNKNTEENPPAVSDSINDWKDGSHASTDLTEKDN